MSVPSDIPYTVLVVNDSNFKHVCIDPVEYAGRLRKTLETRHGSRLNLLTVEGKYCLLYTSPSPRDLSTSRMPSSA